MTQILDPQRATRRRWPKVIALALAALALLTIGVAVGGADRTKLDAANKASVVIGGKLATAQSQLGDVSGQLTDVRGQLSTLQGKQAGLQAGVDAAKAANDSAKALNDQTKAANDQRAQQLDSQAAALTAQTEAANASSFSDGLYQVGTDIKAGKYHSAGGTGGAGCYWAKLHTSDTSNFIGNNLSDGPQTVVVDSPYFDTNNCGTWTKVG